MDNIGDTGPIRSMISATSLMISGGNFSMTSGPAGSQRGASFLSVYKICSTKIHVGRDTIIQAASPNAFYDSRQHFETPKRLTGDQIAHMNAIRDWVFETKTPLMWLYGPASSGKTVLARSIADWCAQDRLFLSSYFFSRTDSSRNSSSSFIATIAYGIAQAIPSVQPLMDRVVDKDPLIFSRSLETQFVKLVLEPLVGLYQDASHEPLPYVIVIDGLDECTQSNEQKAIFDLFTFAFDSYSLPWKVLISSRPERTIQDLFQGCRSPRCLYTTISLSNPANAFELPPRDVQEATPKQTDGTKPKQRRLRLLSIGTF